MRGKKGAKGIGTLILLTAVLLAAVFLVPVITTHGEASALSQDISVRVTYNRNGTIRLRWSEVKGAAYYTVTKKACSAYKTTMTFDEGDPAVTTDGRTYKFKGLYPGRLYTFRVTARNSEGAAMTRSRSIKAQPVITKTVRKSRKSTTVSASRMDFANGRTNLREYIGEPSAGYSVVQGSCTDGKKYAYYLMVSPYNQNGKIAKVRMKDNALVAVSEVLDIWHGNGMTYDSRRKQLVVTSRDDPADGVYRKQEITCIDVETLTIIKSRQKNVKYDYFRKDKKYFTYYHQSRGLASIAYNKKYDVYLADQRKEHNIIVIDPDTFEAIGLISTKIISKYPGVYQGMDCDDQYVYLLLSPDGSRQKKNLILALDWNSSKLLDLSGHRLKYRKGKWVCRHSGKPAAVYKLKTSHEAESIYHTTDSSGRTHFYLAEYYDDPETNISYMWRLVESAYQLIQEDLPVHRNRLDYVYDLGIL